MLEMPFSSDASTLAVTVSPALVSVTERTVGAMVSWICSGVAFSGSLTSSRSRLVQIRSMPVTVSPGADVDMNCAGSTTSRCCRPSTSPDAVMVTMVESVVRLAGHQPSGATCRS